MAEGVESSHKTSTFGRARRRTLQPAGSSRCRRIHPGQARPNGSSGAPSVSMTACAASGRMGSSRTSWLREPSLAKTFARWWATVAGLMNSHHYFPILGH